MTFQADAAPQREQKEQTDKVLLQCSLLTQINHSKQSTNQALVCKVA